MLKLAGEPRSPLPLPAGRRLREGGGAGRGAAAPGRRRRSHGNRAGGSAQPPLRAAPAPQPADWTVPEGQRSRSGAGPASRAGLRAPRGRVRCRGGSGAGGSRAASLREPPTRVREKPKRQWASVFIYGKFLLPPGKAHVSFFRTAPTNLSGILGVSSHNLFGFPSLRTATCSQYSPQTDTFPALSSHASKLNHLYSCLFFLKFFLNPGRFYNYIEILSMLYFHELEIRKRREKYSSE